MIKDFRLVRIARKKMAKGTRGRRGIASRQCRPTPYPLPSHNEKDDENCSKLFKKDWVDATCSVCMECPHKAVLLLCSSYDKGCRPYMCGTNFRYSNCLDQYKKAYTKVMSSQIPTTVQAPLTSQSSAIAPFPEAAELACPLCRGQVKGWTVVEPAREDLNCKKRNCMQDGCSFVGTFKELRKHVKAEHPSAKPREVDPTLEQKWRRMEREREREDVMSTIRSSTPGAVFFGDYVIEGNHHYEFDSDDEDEEDEEGFDGDAAALERSNEGGGGGGSGGGVGGGIDRNLMSVFLFLQAFGNRRDERESNGTLDAFDFSDNDDDDGNEDGGNNGASLVGRLRREGRVLLGSSRRRRHREADGGQS
ncbi:hypothetical protein ACP275_02G066500 [Erythranthe tilingii]